MDFDTVQYNELRECSSSQGKGFVLSSTGKILLSDGLNDPKFIGNSRKSDGQPLDCKSVFQNSPSINEGYGQSRFKKLQPVNAIEEPRMADSPPQGSLVIHDAKKFSNELRFFVLRFCCECDQAECYRFLNNMIRDGIMDCCEEFANRFSPIGERYNSLNSYDQYLDRGNSLQGISSYDPYSLVETESSRNHVGLGDYPESDGQLRDLSSLFESELASSDNDSTNSSQTNDFDSQESSESKRPWYERLKPCAGDIYIRGKPINRTCEEYCLVSHDNAKTLTDKFYNMNSDGFKDQVKDLIEANPSEDANYLLDLVLCAHVRKGYSFDLSKKGPRRKKSERILINWIRRERRRIVKKNKGSKKAV